MTPCYRLALRATQPSRPLRSRTQALTILVLAAAALSGRGIAQTTEHLPGPTTTAAIRGKQLVAELGRDITSILSDRNFNDATWGISVISCESGEPLFRQNDGKNRQVASNIKLLTTAASLYRLGGDYQYGTELYTSGEVYGNELNGNLVIRGSGDPSLSPNFGVDPREVIRGWGKVLDSLGIRSVQDIVVDGSYFDDIPYGPGWAWDDETFGFNAPISAAAIFDNSIEVTVKPGKTPGAPVSIDIYPSTAYVTLKVTAVTSRADSTSTLDIRRERGSSVIVVSGNIAASSEPYVEHISVEHPARFFATVMKEELERSGIVVRGEAFEAAEYPDHLTYATLKRVALYLSPPLREIVAATNKQSLNLAAEMMLKKLGREFMGIGSSAAGAEVVKRVMALAGVDIEHIKLYDGSGLSRQNMVSPADITMLLRWAQRTPIGPDFMASLAVAGQDGTLANRMRGTLAEKNVVAKTGFLGGIRALSGYVRTRDGELLAFSIVLNNYSVPTSVVNTAQDLIVMRLASFSRKG